MTTTKRVLKVWADAHLCGACRAELDEKNPAGKTTLATHSTTDMQETSPGVFEETTKARYGCEAHRVFPLRIFMNSTSTPWEA